MEITSGNATLAAESHGSGAPDVLMIHAGVTDQRSWQHLVSRLQGDRRCLTYDTRGYGRTTYQPDEGWSYVDDAVAVLDAYAVEAGIVIGCSNGGRTALDLTLAHPDRVSALVLIAPAISGAPEPEFGPELDEIGAAYDAAVESGDHAELNRLEAWIWLDGPLVPEGRVQGPARDLFLDMNAIALEAADPGERREVDGAWPRLGDIGVPTLVLVGEHDLAHVRANSRHLAEAVPGVRLVELPGVAHLPHLENDDKTISEIAAFVASVGGV
jgi:pimeloyl-ACP methyl ester carboxylesterase